MNLLNPLQLLKATLHQCVAVLTSKAASLLLAWATARVALRGHTGRRAAPRQRAAGRPRLRLLIAAGAFALASIMVFSLQSAQDWKVLQRNLGSATSNLGRYASCIAKGPAGSKRRRDLASTPAALQPPFKTPGTTAAPAACGMPFGMVRGHAVVCEAVGNVMLMIAPSMACSFLLITHAHRPC